MRQRTQIANVAWRLRFWSNLMLLLFICSFVLLANNSFTAVFMLSRDLYTDEEGLPTLSRNIPRIAFYTVNNSPRSANFRGADGTHPPYYDSSLNGLSLIRPSRSNFGDGVPSDVIEDVGTGHHIIASEDAANTPFNLKNVPLENRTGADGVLQKRPSTDCVSLHTWQTTSYPTCNVVHELDMLRYVNHGQHSASPDRHTMTFLARGGNRDVWKISPQNIDESGEMKKALSQISSLSDQVPVVLKTLRIPKKEFEPKNYENQRRDAVAMERLTSSPNVVNIHSFCGQSSITEFAGPTLSAMVKKTKMSTVQKLKAARDVANALADAHSIDGEYHSTLIHGDIKDQNFVLSADATRFKLNDFNFAQFLTWDAVTNSTCVRRARKICHLYRSPEECSESQQTEKVDIYALGGILYFILTGYPPYKYPKPVKARYISELIIAGTTPILPQHLANSSDPALVSIIEERRKCISYDPYHRPNAKEVAQHLDSALKRR